MSSSGSDATARRVVVRGQVQGVSFRDRTLREAESRGVSGWVRNNPDGSVEAVFEGSQPDVEHLVTWASSGPAQAQVADTEVS